MKSRFSALVLLTLAYLSTTVFAWDGSDCCNNYTCSAYTYNSCTNWGVYVLYENVIVRPYFSRNNAYFLENPSGVDGQRAVMFDWDYKYSPRIELGWLNDCGVGLRGRYWWFHNDTTLDATSPDGEIASWFAEDSVSTDLGFDDATSAEFRHKLHIDVADLEAVFNVCKWTYSAGGRYLSMDQKYIATQLAPSTTSFEAKHNFNGGGLTTAVEYFQPVWCGFSLFTKARGSLLYGHSSFLAINAEGDTAIRSRNKHDLIAIGELQLGVDWRFSFCDMCSFLRFAIETQYWIGGGAGGPGDNAVFDEGNYQSSNPQDSHLGFFGFNIGIGLMF